MSPILKDIFIFTVEHAHPIAKCTSGVSNQWLLQFFISSVCSVCCMHLFVCPYFVACTCIFLFLCCTSLLFVCSFLYLLVTFLVQFSCLVVGLLHKLCELLKDTEIQ